MLPREGLRALQNKDVDFQVLVTDHEEVLWDKAKIWYQSGQKGPLDAIGVARLAWLKHLS